MSNRLKLLLLLLAAVALGVWVWCFFFPNPERVIRARLDEVAQLASVGPNEAPLAQLNNAQKLTTFCTKDIQIVVDLPGHSRYELNGNDELLKNALAARSMAGPFKVQFLDATVTLGPNEKTAMVNLTIEGRRPGEKAWLVQEARIEFRKVGRNWLISRAQTVRTLL